MPKIPSKTLALLEKVARVCLKVRRTKPEVARKLAKAVHLALVMYETSAERVRPAHYVSATVRFRGMWRNWCDAGLQHLPDAALVRFCGFPMKVLLSMERAMRDDPSLAALRRESRYWKVVDPRNRPACDVLDLIVLVLRQLATVGYQHQLVTDMGVPMSSISRYLAKGKKAMLKMLKGHASARVGMFEDAALGYAAHKALEEQHGECPMVGITFAFAIDGTVSAMHAPDNEEDKALYFSVSKRIHGVNTVLLVSPLGTVHAYRVCLPGNVPDTTAAEPIFSWLFDPAVNPELFGALVDYGFAKYCHAMANLAPVARPFCPTKDPAILNRVIAGLVAEMSRWVCSCRQFNEWLNGSAKRGFPRWLMKHHVYQIRELEKDMELYVLLYNFRVRECEWSQTRTVYLDHMKACFDEQGMTYNERDGSYTPKEDYAGPPEDDDDD